jgi:hypothetical protein
MPRSRILVAFIVLLLLLPRASFAQSVQGEMLPQDPLAHTTFYAPGAPVRGWLGARLSF